jgi:hypothetical protein
MIQNIIKWLDSNVGKTFQSPRKGVFGGNPSPIKIARLTENKIEIDFIEKRAVVPKSWTMC